MRFHVEPLDVPPAVAARRLGLTLEQFQDKLPDLLRRGFPAPDETTGHFCLEAIDRWRVPRFPPLFPLTCIERPNNRRVYAHARIRSMGFTKNETTKLHTSSGLKGTG